jgi:hypothetical protein
VTIDIDFGDEKSFWRDTRLKTDAGKIKKFNPVIDALIIWAWKVGHLLMRLLFAWGENRDLSFCL